MHGDVLLDRGDEFRDAAKHAVAKRWVVMSRKKRSTMLSQDAEVGVKWTRKRGCLAEPLA